MKQLDQADLRRLLSWQDTLKRSRLLLARREHRPVGLLAWMDPPPLQEGAKVFAFAVHPDLRSAAVDAKLAASFHDLLRKEGRDLLYLTGIGAHSARMVSFSAFLGCTVDRVHRTFRIWFDGRPVQPEPLYAP